MSLDSSERNGDAPTPTQGIKRFWVAEGHGPNNRQWLCFAYEDGKQWHEVRLYGPPSVAFPRTQATINGNGSHTCNIHITLRLNPVLELALAWIANPLPATLQIIKDRYEDERE